MGIELATFNAFALESCAAPAVAGEGHTLTMVLRAERSSGAAPMSGRITLTPKEPVLGRIEHSGIVEPVLSGALTITF
jgi:hypothetical protein